MANTNQAGKGSRPRPVKGEVFRDNYEAIFGKRKERKTMPMFNYENTVKPDLDEAEKAKKREERIADAVPYKTKQCPHCATFSLIPDPDDMEGWLFCKKCGWNAADPYTD